MGGEVGNRLPGDGSRRFSRDWRVAIVTAASSVLGIAIAKAREPGADVVRGTRRFDRLPETLALIEGLVAAADWWCRGCGRS